MRDRDAGGHGKSKAKAKKAPAKGSGARSPRSRRRRCQELAGPSARVRASPDPADRHPRLRAALRRSDCTGPGIPAAARTRLPLPRLRRRARRRPRGARAHPRARHPARVGGRLDLPLPGGHIQATGIDAAGRKQYLYHQRWRERRDQEKFDDMVDFARSLPAMRERWTRTSSADDLSCDHVLACAVRLLDRGFFRVGGEDYAVQNETYGLATMRKRHVRLRDDVLLFDYPAKHGKRRVQAVVDPAVADVVARLKRRRGGGDELLAYKRRPALARPALRGHQRLAEGRHRPDVSAKDFRTWGATVLAAVALAVSSARRPPDRRASARSPAPSRRSRTTWATRRPWPAPRTSTRACSTASATARRSTTRWSRRGPTQRRRHGDPGPGRGRRPRPARGLSGAVALGGRLVRIERLDRLLARGPDREDLVQAVISNVLAMFASVLTIVSTPSRERRRLTAPMRTPSAVESRNVVSVRSTTIRVRPDSSASPSAALSSGAVNRSISPPTATTWRGRRSARW